MPLRSVESIRRYHTPAAEWCERLESARIELQDLASSMSDEAEEVTFSPKRLAKSRLAWTSSVGSCTSTASRAATNSSPCVMPSLAVLSKSTPPDEHLTALSEALKKREAEVLRLGKALSKTRTKAARTIEGALITTLHELGMPHVRFVIRQDILDAPTLHGLDHVTFLFSANKEIEPEPVAEIASGGEISRLMLAIKALIADRRSLPTIIFDEIDTGVSGETAERIATILRRMGESMQVLAVTHLPQIAAAGEDHFYIYKEHGEASTRSYIRHLTAEERIDEIARMQSGSKLTDVTRAAAKALLETAQS